ncbi:hypothetical protein F4604DRAFT_1685451 [Suillus subluteus]|nr:hypothetical protein F4604DRAFT_1685451 [Suillus subluteus]
MISFNRKGNCLARDPGATACNLSCIVQVGLSPAQDIQEYAEFYFNIGMNDVKIVHHLKDHYDDEKYGLSMSSKFASAFLTEELNQSAETFESSLAFMCLGVNDVWTQDQHDKWQCFGLFLHAGLIGSKSGGQTRILISLLDIILMLVEILEHQNIKPEILWSILRKDFAPGFENILEEGVVKGLYDIHNTLQNYIFRWLAIPWLQAELDAWVPIPGDLIDEVEGIYAPPDHPVFELVPPIFGRHAQDLYASLGKPRVSSKSFWDVYQLMRQQFEALE